ncbi:MAG: NAD-dependent epimerase/dehydratase family protein, partial [Rhodospirillales bacterium]|nr:NAD-dependent epimerase/dehydratase family protein [Rhodospirillales bacterium]
MTDKTILITGGLGFIGQALFARLLETGHNVRILDNLSNASTTADDATAAGVNVRVGDIRDRSACDDAVDGVDGVIHLAAQTSVLPSVEAPEIDLELNGFGTLNILSACNAAGVRRVVCASSNAVVGLVEP